MRICERTNTCLGILIIYMIVFVTAIGATNERFANLGGDVAEVYRPIFHVLPLTGWINDPCGPFYDTSFGLYHVFWQENPFGAVWGNMSWGHAVSADLVHWAHLPVALSPDEEYDAAGVFTGSVTMVNGTPIAVYTCVSHTAGQRQCLASPANASDPLLAVWTKSPDNPVVRSLPPGCIAGNFRDDTTAWREEGSGWVLGVGTELATGVTGNSRNGYVSAVELYNSTDFVSWTPGGILWSVPTCAGASSSLSEPAATLPINCSDMMENPELYPLPGAPPGTFLAKFSAKPIRVDTYALGSYTAGVFTPNTAGGGLYDAGQFYASKSFNDSRTGLGRRVLWGWVREEDANASLRGWAGVLSLPRVVTYTPEAYGSVAVAPLPELAALRQRIVGSSSARSLPSDSSLVVIAPDAGRHIEIEAYLVFEPSGEAACAGVAVFADAAGGIGGVGTRFGICIPESGSVEAGNLTLDRSHTGGDGPNTTITAPLPTTVLRGTTLLLRVFADGSVVEAFALGGAARITGRVYPSSVPAPVAAGVWAAGAGAVALANATVWEMGSVWESPEEVLRRRDSFR